MTYFTPIIDKYFAAWILPDTWDSGHPLDTQRFYRFVMAISHFSKAIRRSPLDLNNPILSDHPVDLRPKFAKTLVGFERNPRTFDKKALKEKILLAIKRNHPNFHKESTEELVGDYVEKAMIILDVLWSVKQIGFPDQKLQRWNPPFK